MDVWKISYVVNDSRQPGGITNLDHAPVVGERFSVGGKQLEILEVLELVPPRGPFHYMHVTCRIVDDAKGDA